MVTTYQLISSDSHLEVVPERWSHRMPARLREGAPRTIRTAEGGDALAIGDDYVQLSNPIDLWAGRDLTVSNPFDARYEDTAGTGPPEQRLKEQDEDGVDAEVLFAGQVGGPAFWRNVTDDAVYKAVIRAYNDWLAEEYCAVAPDRLIGLGVMPWTNAEDMVAEMEHCAKLGLKGVTLGVLPSAQGYPTPEDDRFWAAAVDMKMAVTVHVRFYRTGHRADQPAFMWPGVDPEAVKKFRRTPFDWVTAYGLESALPMSQLMFGGVFDRFPDLKVFFAETRTGWLPFWTERADYHLKRHGPLAERFLGFKLKRLPSEYVKEHIYFSLQTEPFAVETRHHMGVDKIMYATDFPHHECEYPNTKSVVEGLFADVPEEEAHLMKVGNAVRFFGLDAAG